MSTGQRMDLEDQAMRLMPKGWGDPDGWLNKFLKAKGIPREEQVTSEQVMAALHGGPVLKSDNTRVNKIPNKGEGVYEATPQGLGDLLPFIGTYRAAKRIDNGEPNASYKDLIVNGAMDLLGAGMIGSVVKAAGKANRITKALKSRGFIPGSKEGIYIKLGATGPINRASGNVKQIPTVDYYNVAMQPMIQSLRVPAIAIGK